MNMQKREVYRTDFHISLILWALDRLFSSKRRFDQFWIRPIHGFDLRICRDGNILQATDLSQQGEMLGNMVSPVGWPSDWEIVFSCSDRLNVLPLKIKIFSLYLPFLTKVFPSSRGCLHLGLSFDGRHLVWTSASQLVTGLPDSDVYTYFLNGGEKLTLNLDIETSAEVLDRDIQSLDFGDLNGKIQTSLQIIGIRKMRDLLEKTDHDLLRYPHFNLPCLSRVHEVLDSRGLQLRQ